MYVTLFTLFFIPLCSGLSIYFVPTIPNKVYKLLLVFGGSYLFSFMLVHMLPELFSDAKGAYETIGLCLLLGFFLQILLDFFSKGIAHGHVETIQHAKAFHLVKIIPMVIALCIHALLDGVLLNLSITSHTHHHCSESLLLGILLHKMPIAFTLAIMLNRIHRQKTVFILLCLFSLTSPIGWILAHSLQTHDLFSLKLMLIIRAVALGNLLHIATTILFESSPQHHFNAQKLCVILAGGMMASAIVFV